MIGTYYGEKVFKVNQHDVLLCQSRRSMHNGKKVKKKKAFSILACL